MRSAAGGAQDAPQRLVEMHLQLVVLVAEDYADRGCSLIDLIEAARAYRSLSDRPGEGWRGSRMASEGARPGVPGPRPGRALA
jgi:hypothetical protein